MKFKIPYQWSHMWLFRVNIQVVFEEGGEPILFPMSYTSWDNGLFPSERQILGVFTHVMGLPFKDLPRYLKGNFIEQILVKKRLEGFRFPPIDKVKLTLG